MFTEFFHDLGRGKKVDSDQLQRRFDLAMTKKLGVVKLPPSFWMQDPKINPRADHLLWVALLLADADRAALAFSALAVEHDEQQKKRSENERESMGEVLERSVQQLLSLLPDEDTAPRRLQIRTLVNQLIPTP